MIALFRVRNELTVATDDPLDLDKIDRIERTTGLTVRPVFAFKAAIERMMRRAYEDDFHVDAVTADLDDAAVELRADASDVDVASVHQLVEGSPVINLVNYLVLQAVRKSASDIHIEPGRKFATVRYRVDGQLVEVLRPRRDIYPAIVSRIKVMAKMDIAEHRMPQDGRCQVVADGKEVDLRISTLPTVLGEKVVIRVLDKQRLTFNLDELGMPPDVLDVVKELLRKPYGLVLVTGPTGSGKTTTLYSALELIKSVHRNIVTVEDPVEYQIELINQVQVESGRGVSFAGALRSILRQDPDVIMVGEIRDAETAQVAVQAALTGHLVLSTLHTNDSAGAVMRLMDMGVESYKLAAALVGVVAQRLVRTICPHCRTTYYPSAEYLEALHYKGDKRRSFAARRRLPRVLRHRLSRPQGHLRSAALRRRAAAADRPRPAARRDSPVAHRARPRHAARRRPAAGGAGRNQPGRSRPRGVLRITRRADSQRSWPSEHRPPQPSTSPASRASPARQPAATSPRHRARCDNADYRRRRAATPASPRKGRVPQAGNRRHDRPTGDHDQERRRPAVGAHVARHASANGPCLAEVLRDVNELVLSGNTLSEVAPAASRRVRRRLRGDHRRRRGVGPHGRGAPAARRDAAQRAAAAAVDQVAG